MITPQYYSGAIDATGCISNGWNLIKPNYWMYFGISILSWVILSCIPIANIFLIGPVLVGVYFVFFREMRGEPVEFGMMFKGFEKFVPAMVVGLIQSIPGIIFQILQITLDLGRIFAENSGVLRSESFFASDDAGVAVAGGFMVLLLFLGVFGIIFGIAWHITFVFALPILADNDIGPIEAITLSAKAGWSNVGGLIILAILQFFVAVLGVLAICIGVFFVLPIIYAASAFAYRQVFPDLSPAVYRNTPPPPDVYGGNFGQGQNS